MSTIVILEPGAHQWTCPERVTSVEVEAQGGSGSGGQPGEVTHVTLKTTPGATYEINVGAGGRGGSGQDGWVTLTYEPG